MGLDYNMQLLMSGALNCVQLMGVLSSLWTLDRFGRRNILLLGSVCMCLSHVVIAILVGKFSHDWPSYVTEGWVSVAFLFAFMLSFGFSWVSSALALDPSCYTTMTDEDTGTNSMGIAV